MPNPREGCTNLPELSLPTWQVSLKQIWGKGSPSYICIKITFAVNILMMASWAAQHTIVCLDNKVCMAYVMTVFV